MKTQKLLLQKTVLVMMMVLFGMGNLFANDLSKDNKVDRRSMKEINKFIRKEAKELKRAGFNNEFGALPVEMQLRESYKMEMQRGADGKKMYVIGSGSANAGTANAASMHALTDAMLKACLLIETKMFGLVENDYNNKQYSRSEFKTLSKMKGAFSGIVASELNGGEPVALFYKDNGEFYEYQVRIAYPIDVLVKKTKDKILDELEKESDDLRKKFEKMTGLDRMIL